MNLSKLGKEIIVKKTTISQETIKLGEGEFACPHCEFSSGLITVGHRDGPGRTGLILVKCGLCKGKQIVVPCKTCGKLIAKPPIIDEFRECFECTKEKFEIRNNLK